MPSDKDGAGSGPLNLLSLLSSGAITVTVGGFPLLSIDSQQRTLDVEIQGAKEAGLKLSDLMEKQEGRESHPLRGAESIARELSRLGWRLTLYNEGSRAAVIGSGVSRLTGHMSVNPLKLKGLLDALK